MTQGEKHMKRRKNQFREALDARREALATAANQPKSEKQPEWEPETPELRAEDLETMRRYHQSYGVPHVGLFARVKRLVGGRGL
jgi:hypothetical protein